MDDFIIDLPAIPVGMLVLLNFFAPYASALVINPRWSSGQKKIVAVVSALVVAAVVIGLSVAMGWSLPDWPVLLILGVIVSQASYDLVIGKSADRVSEKTSKGDSIG